MENFERNWITGTTHRWRSDIPEHAGGTRAVPYENGPKALVQHALRRLMLFIASRATKVGEEGGNEAREFARDVLEPMVLGG